MKYAEVRVLNVPWQADRDYEYAVPDELENSVMTGSLVAVPFGAGNRAGYAIVVSVSESSSYSKPKKIISDSGIVLPRALLRLCFYLSGHVFCSVGDAVRASAPVYALSKLKDFFSPVNRSVPDGTVLSSDERKILDYMSGKSGVALDSLIADVSPKNAKSVFSLVSKGLLERSVRLIEKKKTFETNVSLSEGYAARSTDELCSLVRGKNQRQVLSFLSVSGSEKMSVLRHRCAATEQTVRSLEKAGIVDVVRTEITRDPYKELSGESPLPSLSDSQKAAADKIGELRASGKPAVALLFGVTGSGKTAVIGSAIDSVIKSGKQVILLVPEIALTPQTVGIFYLRYKGRVAVLHSGLSDGERYDAWHRIKNGEVDLCIGTRSAVFAPFSNLGLIVMDEEHEHSYKSETNPKYHARDVAKFRCAEENALLLLASATPSLESFSKAKSGKYTLIRLDGRYGGAALPDIVISDMRRDGLMVPLGSDLKVALANVLERKEQAILFVNRRGYNNFLSCPLCGKPISCPHCSVSYTYHSKASGGGYLYCHWCGNKENIPSACPECGGSPLRRIGFGTQKVEEELKNEFGGIRVLRLDSDTTQSKSSYDEILGAFRRKEADVLVGTQMVTKGHDFPDVTLVGVLNADSALYGSTFSGGENSFTLFTQVIGRAGRSSKKGIALIQTSNPSHTILRNVLTGDYEAMYTEEIALRRTLVFPPYCNMAVFTLSSSNESELMRQAVALKSAADAINDVPLTVFGPVEASVYKIDGLCRLQIVIKCVLNSATREKIKKLYSDALKKAGNSVSVSIDVDPN